MQGCVHVARRGPGGNAAVSSARLEGPNIHTRAHPPISLVGDAQQVAIAAAVDGVGFQHAARLALLGAGEQLAAAAGGGGRRRVGGAQVVPDVLLREGGGIQQSCMHVARSLAAQPAGVHGRGCQAAGQDQAEGDTHCGGGGGARAGAGLALAMEGGREVGL